MIDDTQEIVEVVEPVSGQAEEVSGSQEEQQPEAQQPQINKPAPQEDEKSINLRILRERSEKLERERDELMGYFKQLQAQSIKPQADPDEITLNPDDLPEWKHVTKYIDKRTKSNQEELQKTKQQLYEMTVDARLKAQYEDFDSVVTAENINLLRQKSPALAESINNAQDLYTKASAAYDAIKNFGIVQSSERQQLYDTNQKRIERNLAKPRPAASAAQSPLNSANMFAEGPLTEGRKKQIYAEMERILQSRE